MALKDLFSEINTSVRDILAMDFELTKTQSEYVPNHEDPGLTFDRGKTKKAKTIETCVLYADIRNSTMLSKQLPFKEMAKVYSIFTKSVMTIAEFYGGVVRNIIGDRVMVVFPQKNCFENAVDTAIAINTASSKIIAKHCDGITFSCGIGIDYGQKLVVKAGIPKHDPERSNYKNLIWISDSANIASKLTDIANKEIVQKMFRVTYNPINWMRFSGLSGLLARFGGSRLQPNVREPLYFSHQETKEITAEDFADKISMLDSGSYYFSDGDLKQFTKFEKKVKAAPILITEKVFEEYRKLNPQREAISKGWWSTQNVTIKEYTGKVYGANLVFQSTIDQLGI
jgi:adenylate cyclase